MAEFSRKNYTFHTCVRSATPHYPGSRLYLIHLRRTKQVAGSVFVCYFIVTLSLFVRYKIEELTENYRRTNEEITEKCRINLLFTGSLVALWWLFIFFEGNEEYFVQVMMFLSPHILS